MLEALALLLQWETGKEPWGPGGEVALEVEVLVLLVIFAATDAQLGGGVLFSASSSAEVLLLSLGSFSVLGEVCTVLFYCVIYLRGCPRVSIRPAFVYSSIVWVM